MGGIDGMLYLSHNVHIKIYKLFIVTDFSLLISKILNCAGGVLHTAYY
jgi:hypothetical protein